MIKTRFESGLGALMPSYSSSLTMDITASRYPWWGTAANYKPHAWSDWGEVLRGSWCNWEAKMVLRKAFQISAVQRLSMRQMVFQPCWYSVPQTKPWAHFCCSFPYNSSWESCCMYRLRLKEKKHPGKFFILEYLSTLNNVLVQDIFGTNIPFSLKKTHIWSLMHHPIIGNESRWNKWHPQKI